MAFEGLSSRLQAITRKLGGKARITESDLNAILANLGDNLSTNRYHSKQAMTKH